MKLAPALLLAAAIAACSGACSGPSKEGAGECTPGESRCDSNAYQTCADDGARWVTQLDCSSEGQMCVRDLGCRTCAPHDLRCGADGFEILRCRPDGSAQDVIGRCDPELGDVCVGAGMCENACGVAAQASSYEGCDYWAVDLDNAVVSDQGTAAAQQYSIVVSNPLEVPATVTVEVNDALPGQPPMVRTVAEVHLDRVPGGGDLEVIDLPPRELDGSSDPRLNDGSGTFLSSNAYHLRSTAPIVAYQFNPLENVGVFSNDASLLFPSAALGQEYLVLGWPQTLAITDDAETNGTIDLRATLTIVGTEVDTDVTIQLTTDILGGGTIPPSRAGERIDLRIGAYDAINLETDGFNADFSGTSILASRPVAVFVGSEASDAPTFDTWRDRDCCADHVEEQMMSLDAFGKRFVAVKTPMRSKYVEEAGWDVAVNDREPEVWRVLGTTEDQGVSTTLPEPEDGFLLNHGSVHTIETDRDFLIWSDDPIAFAQIPVSQQATGIPSVILGGDRPPGGDPSLIFLPPLEQWKDEYVFLVPNKYAFDFLLIATPSGTELLYDGVPIDTALTCEIEPIGKFPDQPTEYVARRCPLSYPVASDPNNPAYQDDGRHTLQSRDGAEFGLVVWGWDRFVSYGYTGGQNLLRINPD